MTKSEIMNYCAHHMRQYSRIIYVLLTLWTLVVLFGTIITRPTNQHRVRGSELETKEGGNIFEKWYHYQSKGRNLLEDDSFMFSSNNFATNSSKKKSGFMFDISEQLGKTNADLRDKVFATLNSLRFETNPNVPDIDCPAIMDGKTDAILKGKLASLELGSKMFEERKNNLLSSLEKVQESAQDCDKFIKDRKYITSPLSMEESSYSIAYIITIHRDLPSFERLLRSIYHPQNVYCIHVDKKSEDIFKNGVATVANCFDNVFIASNLTSVRYSHYSRVQADVNCMQDLVGKARSIPWRYVINLCGQDFPLKTNLEIVRALKNLQGFNNVETIKTPEHKKKRYMQHYDLPDDPKGDHATMKRSNIKKSPPPHDIEMFAGSAYYIFKRKAVEFMLTNPKMQKFFKWNEDTYSPDEHMWATIQRMFPQVPGSFPPHEKYDLNELQTITRLVKWAGLDKKVYPKCEGRFLRGICVYGCGDLAWLITQKHIYANKFDANVDYLAIHCLETWIRNRTIEQSVKYIKNGFL